MIYVSGLYPCCPTRRWRYDEIAYMVADTMQELHSEAAKQGLQRKWFTGRCYNLTRSRRALVLRKGAQEIADVTKFTELTRRMVDGGR